MGPENDPIRVTVDFARQHGLECVFSFRMNDIHDAFIPGRLNPFQAWKPPVSAGKLSLTRTPFSPSCAGIGRRANIP